MRTDLLGADFRRQRHRFEFGLTVPVERPVGVKASGAEEEEQASYRVGDHHRQYRVLGADR